MALVIGPASAATGALLAIVLDRPPAESATKLTLFALRARLRTLRVHATSGNPGNVSVALVGDGRSSHLLDLGSYDFADLSLTVLH